MASYSACDYLDDVQRALDIDEDSGDPGDAAHLAIAEIERLQAVDLFWQEHGANILSCVTIISRSTTPECRAALAMILAKGPELIQPDRTVVTLKGNASCDT
jgi:hypothetical protein